MVVVGHCGVECIYYVVLLNFNTCLFVCVYDFQCGFSRTIVGMLKADDVPFGHFNILEDDDVRQGLKTFSDWPTYPQVYVKGELIGGLDILKEMKEDGSLKEQLAAE